MSTVCVQSDDGTVLIRLGLVALLGGCSAAPTDGSSGIEGAPSTTSGNTPEPTLVTSTTEANSTEQPASTSSGPSSTSSTSSATTALPDFGAGDDFCNGKIDFLFVVNRAHYMEPWWGRFHAALPGFIDRVFDTFDGYDMHFMAIDGIGGWGVSACAEPCQQNGSCDEIPGFPCERYIHDSVQGCDLKTHGAGVIFPTGIGAANRDCGPLEGQRYISSQQVDAVDAVKCIGQVGYGLPGEWAYAIGDMLHAVTPKSPAWDCNGDFLRDDAMLVIVLLDQKDAPPCFSGPPGEWAEIIYGAKGGDKDRVMVIGLLDDSSGEGPTICPGSGSEDYGLCTASFLHHYVKHRIEGSRCAEDYTPYFDAGLDMLGQLCEQDIPT